MLLASLIPMSTIFPGVIIVIKGPVPLALTTAAPEPVTVHWADCGLWFPSSSGKRNCFSALQKWLDVAHNTLVAAPDSTKTLPRHKLSTKVEQAPNTPKKGIFNSRKPKLEEIHWFNKSPAKQ